MNLSRKLMSMIVSFGLILIIAVPGVILFLDDALPSSKAESSGNLFGTSGDIPHIPIFIDSDDDFGTLGFPGDGSAGNPYRIENYVIDGTSTDICINITGTTVHFTIKNCTLRGLESADKAGIYLDNIEHGFIVNNTAFNCTVGLVLSYADNNTIEGNSFYENGYGISIGSGENNTIENNNCSHNSYAGVNFYQAHRNRVINNVLEMNEWDIKGWRSDYNNVTGNTMGDGISKQAIFWDDSRYNRIEDNLVEDCTNGIRIYSSDGFTIANNTVRRCSSAIWVSAYGSQNMIYDNLIVDNLNGILLATVSGNSVFNNNCTNNNGGIQLIDRSHINDIYQNELRNCTYGVSVTWDSSNNNVTDNFCVENEFGIYIHDDAYRNHIELNLCLNNTVGIGLSDTTHNNTVVNNICSSTAAFYDYGILVSGEAADNYISENNCTLNDCGICFSGTTSTNIATDNFIYLCQTGVCLNATARVKIEVNIIKDCNLGIEISAKTNISFVRWNTILFSSGVSAVDDGVGNIFDYNYWSDYAGVDANSDGIGDTPYPITGTATNADPHPVVYYPTRPTWDHAIETQSGEAGYPFSYNINASAAAPIGNWGVDDTVHFAIDGDGVITNAMALSIGDYEVEVWVETIYGVNLTATFMVIVTDTIAPTVDHPDDITFPQYSLNQSLVEITWNPSDMTDLDYVILVEGEEDNDGSWSPGDGPLTLDFGYLQIGTFNITIIFTDQGGNTVSDTVMVIVTEEIITTTTTTTTTTTATTTTLDDTMIYILTIGALGVVIVIIVAIIKWKRT